MGVLHRIDQHMTITLIPVGAAPIPVPVEWRYSIFDPYAVHLHFPDQGVAWLFGRALLDEGMTFPAGEGDVRIRPDEQDTDRLRLQLRDIDEGSWCEFTVPLYELDAWLAKTYALVPETHERVDVDDLIARCTR